MTPSRGQSPARRPVVLAAIGLVVAAVLLVAVRSWLDPPVAEDVVAERNIPIVEPPPRAEPPAEIEPPSSAPEVAPAVIAPAAPIKVILLPARIANSDPATEALFDAIRQATLLALRDMANVEVVDVGAVDFVSVSPPNADVLPRDNRVLFAAIRRYQGDIVAEISEGSRGDVGNWEVVLHARRLYNGFGMNTMVITEGPAVRNINPGQLGASYAQRIVQVTDRPSDRGDEIGEAQAVLLNPARPEQDRVLAMFTLQDQYLDSAAIAAATDLATRSPTTLTRQQVWALLRQSTFDPVLAQPLTNALLTDPDAIVRKEAALGLGDYRTVSGAQVALEHAARTDGSSEVRLAARMALLDRDGRLAFQRSILLDSSLTAAERLGSITMDVWSESSISGTDEESNRALAEIAVGTDDPELKRSALYWLVAAGALPGPEVRRAMLDGVEHENRRVRLLAIQGLLRYAGNAGDAEVRAALEAAVREEPEFAAASGLEEALRRTP